MSQGVTRTRSTDILHSAPPHMNQHLTQPQAAQGPPQTMQPLGLRAQSTNSTTARGMQPPTPYDMTPQIGQGGHQINHQQQPITHQAMQGQIQQAQIQQQTQMQPNQMQIQAQIQQPNVLQPPVQDSQGVQYRQGMPMMQQVQYIPVEGGVVAGIPGVPSGQQQQPGTSPMHHAATYYVQRPMYLDQNGQPIYYGNSVGCFTQ